MKSVNITLPSISKLAPQIKLEGKWVDLDKVSDNLQKSTILGYDRGIKTIGHRLLRIIRRSLLTGVPPESSGITWEPLSPKTISRYGQHSIYNLTGLYARSIGLKIYKSRILVGIPYRSRRASQKGLTLNQLAILLEYGSERIPSRPVWGPSLTSIGGRQAIKKELMKQIRISLYSSGIRANQVR